MLVTIAAFLFVLGVLIFVHELGHFLAAKAVGIGVPRFSIGFGPPTPLRFRRGETEYVIAWFPLGGYVKMASREEQDAMSSVEGGETPEEFPPEQLFESKSLAARVMVISAGVVANVLFGWLAFTALAAVYGRSEDPTTAVVYVDEPLLPIAAKPLAAMPRGAQIVKVNGDTVGSWDQIVAAIADPVSDRLRFDFAGDLDPIIVPIRGTAQEDRARVAMALRPMWPAHVGEVQAGRPAHEAGLERGDRIIAIDGDTVRAFYDLQQAVEPAIGDTLRFTVLRADSLFVATVVPVEATVDVPFSQESRTVGRIGVNSLLEPVFVRFGPLGAAVEGWRRTWATTELVVYTLKGILFREISAREVGGPILIGQMSGQFARVGFSALLAFMALLSVNLAVLNLLPIPVLDGGHLVFLLIEGIRGKPLSLASRMRLIQVGMVLLVGIVILVFTNDIMRLFGG